MNSAQLDAIFIGHVIKDVNVKHQSSVWLLSQVLKLSMSTEVP